MVRTSFRKNAALTDQSLIEARKSDAIRALSNYLLTTNLSKDPTVNAAARKYHERSVLEIQQQLSTPDGQT
jgi:hypothetical protein